MFGSRVKSWTNEGTTIKWLKRIWGRHVTTRPLLVWDTFRGHMTPAVKDKLRTTHNIDIAYIPGGCTSVLQPADVSWNKPFKNHFAELYDEWMITGPFSYTQAGNRKPPPKATILAWIKQAWEHVTPEIVRKSFKKCGSSCSLDGSEDHLFNEDDDGDFEGFTPLETSLAEDNLANSTSAVDTRQLVLSEESEESDASFESDDYEDCNSPGH